MKRFLLPIFAIIVVLSCAGAVAARTVSLFGAAEAEQGATTGYARTVADANAIGGQAFQFAEDATTPEAAEGYPAAHTTGYPHGLPGDTRTPVTLTPYTGPCLVRIEGTVIDSKLITCQLDIRAKNVVIKNSLFKVANSGAINSRADDNNLLIVDTEIDGQGMDASVGGQALVSWTGYTMLRVNAHGSGDIIRAEGRSEVVDSWLHDPICKPGASLLCHNDVIQSTNATHLRIIHNRLENQNSQTSCILLKADIGDISNVIVDNNFLNGGGYSVYWYDVKKADGTIFHVYNGQFTNNRFMRAPTPGAYWPKGGQFGPRAMNAATMPAWTNNTWVDNGQQITL